MKDMGDVRGTERREDAHLVGTSSPEELSVDLAVRLRRSENGDLGRRLGLLVLHYTHGKSRLVSSRKGIKNTYSLLSGQVEDQVGGDEGLGRVVQEHDILVLEAREVQSGNLALESAGGAFGVFPVSTVDFEGAILLGDEGLDIDHLGVGVWLRLVLFPARMNQQKETYAKLMSSFQLVLTFNLWVTTQNMTYPCIYYTHEHVSTLTVTNLGLATRDRNYLKSK